MKKIVWVSAGAAVLLAVSAVAVLFFAQNQNANTPHTSPEAGAQDSNSKESTTGNQTSSNSCEAADVAAGRYAVYEQNLVAECGYKTTVLFFHASWCVECRGFEQAIESGDIPTGVQILKVDYDSAQDLRKTYGVTIQSTFVRVDQNGEKKTTWTGYGKDKSITAIIENTK